ncbi:MAG: hypothetical protein ACREP7_20865 [Lysobacter sp.]
MFQSNTVGIEILCGRIERLRIAAPYQDGRVQFGIAGRSVHGCGDTLYNGAFGIQALRRMAACGLPATVAVRHHDDGRCELLWAVAPGSAGFIPVPAWLRRKQAVRPLVWSLLGVAASTPLAAWLLPRAHAGAGWMVAYMVAAAATIFCLYASYWFGAKWLRLWRERAMLAGSDLTLVETMRQVSKQHRAWRRRIRRQRPKPTLKRTFVDDADPMAPSVTPLPTASGDAPLQRLSGRMPHIWCNHARLGEGSGEVRFRVYRFDLCGRERAFHVLLGFGDVAPFIAAGDRIEAVAHAHSDTTPVYGLRNLEDGRVYLAHGVFRGREDAHALTGYTARAYWLRFGLFAVAAVGGVGLCELAYLFDPGELPSDDRARHLLFGALLAGMAAMAAVPFVWSRWRWRIGRGDARQRLTERVYAAFGLGSPLARLPDHARDL